MNAKTLSLVKEMNAIIEKYDSRITVRQLYYQLVASQFIENSKKSYTRMDYILTKARKAGLIDAFAIIDRSKPLLKQSSWLNLPAFVETVKTAYKRSVWQTQPEYVEVWIEKDALAGLIKPITDSFDCYLAVGRGYQSFTNKVEAVERFANRKTTLLYFGDFDPTGMDISRDIEVQLNELGALLKVERVALNASQVKEFNLPPMLTKPSDSRTAKHIELYGDIAVELDALPPNQLVLLVENSIKAHLDFDLFNETIVLQESDLTEIRKWVEAIK